MEIHRGPSVVRESFHDDSREYVDTVNLDTRPWKQEWQWLGPVNISKKGARNRKATIDIKIEAKDVFALHAALIKGLRKRSKELDTARSRVEQVKVILRKIRERTTSTLPNNTQDSLRAISRMVDSALKALR